MGVSIFNWRSYTSQTGEVLGCNQKCEVIGIRCPFFLWDVIPAKTGIYCEVLGCNLESDTVGFDHQNDGLSRFGDIFAKREGLLRLEESVTICLGGGCLSPLNGDPAIRSTKKRPESFFKHFGISKHAPDCPAIWLVVDMQLAQQQMAWKSNQLTYLHDHFPKLQGWYQTHKIAFLTSCLHGALTANGEPAGYYGYHEFMICKFMASISLVLELSSSSTSIPKLSGYD